MQAGRHDAGIGVEKNVALERRLAGEHGPDDGRRHAFDAGIEVEPQPPRSSLPGDAHVALGPDIGACGEVELGVEIIERSFAREDELGRRQAGKVGEMGEDAARGLLGIRC